MKQLSAVFVFILMLNVGCQSENNGKKESKDINTGKQVQLANFLLELPEGWVQEPADNNLRVTQFAFKDNNEYKLAVFFFGQQDMENENIERWKSQYSQIEKVEKLNINAKGITALTILGTYKKKPYPMAQEFVETEGYGTFAAIVPSKMGPYYFKISASKKFILEHQKEFVALLESYKDI